MEKESGLHSQSPKIKSNLREEEKRDKEETRETLIAMEDR